jgi:hypothetical protein
VAETEVLLCRRPLRKDKEHFLVCVIFCHVTKLLFLLSLFLSFENPCTPLSRYVINISSLVSIHEHEIDLNFNDIQKLHHTICVFGTATKRLLRVSKHKLPFVISKMSLVMQERVYKYRFKQWLYMFEMAVSFTKLHYHCDFVETLNHNFI